MQSNESAAKHSILNAIDLLEHFTATPGGRASTKRADTMRCVVPYALVPVQGLSGTYILVNRQYVPCGTPGADIVNYGDFLSHHVRLTECQLQEVLEPGTPYHLFHDRTAPWRGRAEARKVLERLVRLRDLLDRRAQIAQAMQP